MRSLQQRAEVARAAVTRLRRRFDARAARERILMIGSIVAVVFLATDRVWLTPAFKDWQATRARRSTAAEAMLHLNQDIAQRGAQGRAQEQQLQLELAQWREKIQKGDAELHAFGTTLIGAADMLPVLEHMLAQSGGLRVRNMQSLARTELAAPAAQAPAPAASAAVAPLESKATLYRHGVELTVEGGYTDMLAYLRALEAMPQHVLWGNVQMKVEQYPKVVLTLRLYTLSLDRGWLEI